MVNSGIVKWSSTKQHSNYSFISAPASFTNVSGDHNMTEGSNRQLFCEASGKPAPNITWVRVLRDGSESGAAQGSHLTFFKYQQGQGWDIPLYSLQWSGRSS